jgi:hypothetical protein
MKIIIATTKSKIIGERTQNHDQEMIPANFKTMNIRVKTSKNPSDMLLFFSFILITSLSVPLDKSIILLLREKYNRQNSQIFGLRGVQNTT